MNIGFIPGYTQLSTISAVTLPPNSSGTSSSSYPAGNLFSTFRGGLIFLDNLTGWSSEPSGPSGNSYPEGNIMISFRGDWTFLDSTQNWS